MWLSSPKAGCVTSPSIVLINSRFAHNVGAVVRAASNFLGKSQVIFTGDRVQLDIDERLGKPRIPREERMKGYADVELINTDRWYDLLEQGAVPVGVELLEGAENLATFDHPEKAVYVFGPEDGGLPKVVRQLCHRFVVIPSAHCLNLAAAVNVVLYDRILKQYLSGQPLMELREDRGFIETDQILTGLHDFRG